MRSLSFVLNIVLAILCGVLFFQNRGLKSEISLVQSAAKQSESSGFLSRKINGLTKKSLSAAQVDDLEPRQISEEEGAQNNPLTDGIKRLEEKVEERAQELLEERVEEEVQREIERHHQKRMAHRQERMERVQNRMTEALYEHFEAVDWDPDVIDQVEAVILDDIELHRDVHAQVASGELEHFEARAQIHEHKRAQREELDDLVGSENAHGLLEHLREASHEERGRP